MEGVENKRRGGGSVYWHTSFYAGHAIQLRKYKDMLSRETEHELAGRPLRIDLLVIRKTSTREITDPIASYYRGHNLIEYKSPEDALNIDVLYKTMAYACLYKSQARRVNEIPDKDITVTIFRHAYPRKLMCELVESGVDVVEEYPGIFRVDGMMRTPIRIIVTSRLPKEYASFRVLTKGVRPDDVELFLNEVRDLTETDDVENALGVLEVSAKVNPNVYKGAMSMKYPALYSLINENYEEEFEKGREEGREEGRVQGIVLMCKRIGLSFIEAVESAISDLGLSQMDAERMVKKYW